ncbi:hypothetical protein [Bradyrhizobium liaoningense]|uniref:hypothetical protein n=1 Tax=Bradyrhizobium liaoningense TaxID=43992 RepID=UPI001BAAAB24|nr:hypothetical protein [Bradyrhizobium liaoningense]
MKLRLWKLDVVSRRRPFTRTGAHRSLPRRAANSVISYWNEKTFFQSFFMLMMVQFFFLASA